MNAKPFSLSVVVATVVGAMSLLSAHIDRQEAAEALQPKPARHVVLYPAVPLSAASPLDIDPRRMEAPAGEPATTSVSDDLAERSVAVNSDI